MTWKSWFAVVFAILVSGAGSGSALGASRDWSGADRAQARISVVMESENPLSDEILEGLRVETRRLFAVSDAEVELVLRDPNSHREWDSTVIIARVTGKCQIGAMPPLHPHQPDTLGRTMVTDGVILPFIEIECRQISGAVRSHLLAKPASERDRLLGRAMARILAHEIFHVLVRSHAHSPEGVAAESIRPAQLVSERLDFRVEDLEMMGLLPVMGTH